MLTDSERAARGAEIRCTNCNREGTAKAHIGIRGNKMPDGWEQREIIDPIAGTELVRKWEATLCPECAAKEATTDAGPRGNERSEG